MKNLAQTRALSNLSFESALSRLAPLAGILILLLIAAVLAPTFYSPGNLSNVLRQGAILGIVALGQMIVILVAGIDLSVGGVMGMALVVAAEVSGGESSALVPALLIAFGLGVVVGSANAFLVVVRNVPPFVATLAVFILLEGARLAWTKGVPSGSVPEALKTIGEGAFLGIPLALYVFAAIALVVAFILRRTAYGRMIYAVGSNPTAAKLAGVRVGSVVASTYVISGVLATLGGLILSGYIGYVDRYLGQGFELDSIAAAVVGGASLAGGRGTVFGTITGIALLAILSNLTLILALGEASQLAVKGGVIIAAVALQGKRTRAEA
jgi:ribose/xylose/arabinose/galactoside ABC-type transport system permease subunit